MNVNSDLQRGSLGKAKADNRSLKPGGIRQPDAK